MGLDALIRQTFHQLEQRLVEHLVRQFVAAGDQLTQELDPSLPVRRALHQLFDDLIDPRFRGRHGARPVAAGRWLVSS